MNKNCSLSYVQLKESLDELGILNKKQRTSLNKLLFGPVREGKSRNKKNITRMSMLLGKVASELTVEEAVLLCLSTRALSKTTPILLMHSDANLILQASRKVNATFM